MTREIKPVKHWDRTKPYRKLKKKYWLLEKARSKKYGSWHYRKVNLMLCSECDGITNCTCKSNERAFEIINFYKDGNKKKT